MICDRERISERRAERLDDLKSAERERLLDHLRACDVCRGAALRADPSLVFDLGRAVASDDEGETERMRISVAALRRADRLQKSSAGVPRSLRAAASVLIATLFVAALFVTQGSGGPAPGVDGLPGDERASVDSRDVSPFTGAVSAPADADSPVIEDLDRPDARVYQLTEEDLSLVMIVDESLDL